MPDKPAEACFVDTNIWLYSFIGGDDAAKSATARALKLFVPALLAGYPPADLALQ